MTVLVLQQQGGVSESDFGAGPGILLFVVLTLLVIATILLWRSMRSRLGRIHFDDSGEPRSGKDAQD